MKTCRSLSPRPDGSTRGRALEVKFAEKAERTNAEAMTSEYPRTFVKARVAASGQMYNEAVAIPSADR